jgi:hypothetical protein
MVPKKSKKSIRVGRQGDHQKREAFVIRSKPGHGMID